MEYFGLGDLHDCLADMPPLRASEAGHITFQILEGVFDLHENDFAHRDLKPRVSLSTS
jgi:serine/threonine protein kinase